VAEIIVLGFPSVEAADDVAPQLNAMQREGLIDLVDWARVARHPDGKVDIKQGHSTTAAGAAGGALWGMLFGLIFLMPLGGMVIGGATGALMGKLADYGIDDKFIKDLSKQIAPNTSALFLYVNRATSDKVIERLRPFQPKLLHTSLSQEAEDKLRTAMQSSTPA
jgi:uncharacterized membrane protein